MPFYGLLLIIDYHVGQRLWCHVLAFHLQHLLGLLGLRHRNRHRDIEEDKAQIDREEESTIEQEPEQRQQEEVRAQYQQCIADAPPGGVGVGVGGKAREHTCQNLVVGVTVELFASCPRAYIFTESVSGRLKRVITMPCLLLALGFLTLGVVFACQFLGFADAGDDILHVVDGDCHCTVALQFVEQFGYALFDVVGDFFAALLLAKRGAQRLNVVL